MQRMHMGIYLQHIVSLIFSCDTQASYLYGNRCTRFPKWQSVILTHPDIQPLIKTLRLLSLIQNPDLCNGIHSVPMMFRLVTFERLHVLGLVLSLIHSIFSTEPERNFADWPHERSLHSHCSRLEQPKHTVYIIHSYGVLYKLSTWTDQDKPLCVLSRGCGWAILQGVISL